MKKIWIAAPLALGLTLALTACGGNDAKKDLMGTWSGQVDMMDQVVEGMRITAPEIADQLDMENFYIPLNIEFREDDTYSMTVDQEKLDQSMDDLIEHSVDATLAYMEQMLKDKGITNMTVDQALEQSGMTRESFSTLMKTSLDKLSETMAKQIKTEGQYQAEKEKLYTSDSTDQKPGKGEYTSYTLEGDSLTMDFTDQKLGEVTFTRQG